MLALVPAVALRMRASFIFVTAKDCAAIYILSTQMLLIRSHMFHLCVLFGTQGNQTGRLLEFVRLKLAAGGCVEERIDEPIVMNGNLGFPT